MLRDSGNGEGITTVLNGCIERKDSCGDGYFHGAIEPMAPMVPAARPEREMYDRTTRTPAQSSR
jgi:hypothetical protein